MSKVSITRSKLDNLATSISTKSGAALPLTLDQMNTAVQSISGSGVDTSGDTVDAAHLLSGYTAHDSTGTQIVGGYTPPTFTTQAKSATPTTSQQTITPESGYDGLSSVTVNAIPSEYIIPSGSETKTANGTYDVTNLASLVVQVPSTVGTILKTESLGAVNSVPTTSTSMDKTVTVTDVGDYDMLLVVVYCTKTNSRHFATVGAWWLYGTSDVQTKDTTASAYRNNYKVTSTGVVESRANTTAYGIFASTCTLSTSNGQTDATLNMYYRRNSTQTGTINGTYMLEVYGLNIYDIFS